MGEGLEWGRCWGSIGVYGIVVIVGVSGLFVWLGSLGLLLCGCWDWLGVLRVGLHQPSSCWCLHTQAWCVQLTSSAELGHAALLMGPHGHDAQCWMHAAAWAREHMLHWLTTELMAGNLSIRGAPTIPLEKSTGAWQWLRHQMQAGTHT